VRNYLLQLCENINVSGKCGALARIEKGDRDSSGTLLALVKMQYEDIFLAMNYLLPSVIGGETRRYRSDHPSKHLDC
jgi:hypothetical protein